MRPTIAGPRTATSHARRSTTPSSNGSTTASHDLTGSGGEVVWVQYPVADYLWDEADEPGDDPARYDVLADAIDRVAESGGDAVGVVPLAAWLAERDLEVP